jgi:hypothetical protein
MAKKRKNYVSRQRLHTQKVKGHEARAKADFFNRDEHTDPDTMDKRAQAHKRDFHASYDRAASNRLQAADLKRMYRQSVIINRLAANVDKMRKHHPNRVQVFQEFITHGHLDHISIPKSLRASKGLDGPDLTAICHIDVSNLINFPHTVRQLAQYLSVAFDTYRLYDQNGDHFTCAYCAQWTGRILAIQYPVDGVLRCIRTSYTNIYKDLDNFQSELAANTAPYTSDLVITRTARCNRAGLYVDPALFGPNYPRVHSDLPSEGIASVVPKKTPKPSPSSSSSINWADEILP